MPRPPSFPFTPPDCRCCSGRGTVSVQVGVAAYDRVECSVCDGGGLDLSKACTSCWREAGEYRPVVRDGMCATCIAELVDDCPDCNGFGNADGLPSDGNRDFNANVPACVSCGGTGVAS